MTVPEIYYFCTEKAKEISQMDSDEFIEKWLVDQQFDIYTKYNALWIDFISGVNYYGEKLFQVTIYRDNTFCVTYNGVSGQTFRSDDLYDGLMDGLCDIIEKR